MESSLCVTSFAKRRSDLQFALALEPLSAMSLQRSKTARTHSSNTVLPYNQLGRKVHSCFALHTALVKLSETGHPSSSEKSRGKNFGDRKQGRLH